MKKLLTIILAVMITVSSFLTIGCDKSNKGNGAQSKETDAVTSADTQIDTQIDSQSAAPTDTQPSSQPVAVKDLNGMTPDQLYNKFIAEYTNAKTFDVSIMSSATYDGMQINSSINLKLNNNASYIMADTDDTKMECWFFKDVAYLNVDGEKYKMADTTADDIFGQDFIELTLSGIIHDIDDPIYSEKLEKAQLYLLNGEYYCNLEFTAKEASELGMESEIFSETLLFNAQGKIKKIIDQSISERITVIFDSYGDTVSINAPADKNSYIEQTIPDEDDDKPNETQKPENPSDTQDSSLYAEYKGVFDAIKNAHKFQMQVTTNGSSVLFYNLVGGEYATFLENGIYVARWYVNGKGYIAESGKKATATDVTEEFLAYFNYAREQKDYVAGLQLSIDDMDDFCVLKEYSYSIITLSHDNADGSVDFYEIIAHYANGKISTIYFTITTSLNGEQISSTQYTFIEINSVYLDNIVAPI